MRELRMTKEQRVNDYKAIKNCISTSELDKKTKKILMKKFQKIAIESLCFINSKKLDKMQKLRGGL